MLWLLLFVLVIGLLVDYRKTILLYAPIKLFILNSVILTGHWSFNAVCSLLIIIAYFCHRADELSKKIKTYPLVYSTFILLISAWGTNLLLGFRLQPMISSFVLTLGFCVVLFFCIRSRKDIKLILFSMLICIGIMLTNAFFEQFGHNYIGDYYVLNSPEETFFADNMAYERGIRLQSMFSHSIVFGTICVMLAYLFTFVQIKWNGSILLYIPVSVLLFFMTLTFSRTPILAFLVLFIGLFLQNRLFSWKGFILSVFVLVLYFSFADYIEVMINSLFSQGNQMSGSSFDMRFVQLEVSLQIALSNSIFGIGSKDISYYSAELLGAESVWFQLLVNKGFFGVFAYITLYIEMFIQSRSNTFKYPLIILCLGWLLANTSSNMSGMDDYCLYLLYIIIYKAGLIEGLHASFQKQMKESSNH